MNATNVQAEEGELVTQANVYLTTEPAVLLYSVSWWLACVASSLLMKTRLLSCDGLVTSIKSID